MAPPPSPPPPSPPDAPSAPPLLVSLLSPPPPPALAPPDGEAEPYGWNAVVGGRWRDDPSLGCEHVSRLSDTLVSVALPPLDTYDIASPETLTLTVPGAALASGQRLLAAPPVVVPPSPVAAQVTASFVATGQLTEAMLASVNASELIVTLHGATLADAPDWANGSHARAIIDGLRCGSGAAEPHGWDAVAASRLQQEDVTRLDGITLGISLRQLATYGLRAPETLTLTIPPQVLRTVDAPLVAAPSLTVSATPGVLVLNGSFLSALDEASLRSGVYHPTDASSETETDAAAEGYPLELDAALLLDGWVDTATDGGANLSTALPQLRAAFTSSQAEAAGWIAAVQPSLDYAAVDAATGAVTTARVSLAAAPTYSIDAPETLRLSAPRAAVASHRKVSSSLELVVMPTGGAALLTDGASLYLADGKTEDVVRGKGRLELQLTLTGDTWRHDVSDEGAAADALISSFSSTQNEVAGWNAVVQRTPLCSSTPRDEQIDALLCSAPLYSALPRPRPRPNLLLTRPACHPCMPCHAMPCRRDALARRPRPRPGRRGDAVHLGAAVRRLRHRDGRDDRRRGGGRRALVRRRRARHARRPRQPARHPRAARLGRADGVAAPRRRRVVDPIAFRGDAAGAPRTWDAPLPLTLEAPK